MCIKIFCSMVKMNSLVLLFLLYTIFFFEYVMFICVCQHSIDINMVNCTFINKSYFCIKITFIRLCISINHISNLIDDDEGEKILLFVVVIKRLHQHYLSQEKIRQSQ